MEENKILLPREVDLDKCIALNSAFINARVDLAQLPRFAETCEHVVGDVIANITFEKDLNSMRLIKGEIKAQVTLICQRCAQEYVEPLTCSFELTPDIERAKACHIENKYDFIEELNEGKVDLYELIEDGLILEVPAFPKHGDDDEACGLQGSKWSYGEIDKEAEQSPFAALAALKGNLNADDKSK